MDRREILGGGVDEAAASGDASCSARPRACSTKSVETSLNTTSPAPRSSVSSHSAQWSRAKSGGAFGEGGEDFVLLGEAAFRLLREEELAVGDDVELALRALDDARVDPGGLQRGRETRGPAVVAPSDRAVEDLDAHVQSLLAEVRPVAFDDEGHVGSERQRSVRAAACAAQT